MEETEGIAGLYIPTELSIILAMLREIRRSSDSETPKYVVECSFGMLPYPGTALVKSLGQGK